MTGPAVPLPGGRFAVPGNRWDLLDGCARPSGPPPTVSVVVPYYQNRRQLNLVLAGLQRQDYPTDRFEIIVVDDGSPEPLSLSAGPGPRTRVFRQPDQGFRAAAARNLGAGAAEGQILCFLDQDTVPEPAYLRHLTRLPALVPDALVVGRRRHADLSSWTPAGVQSWFAGTGPAPDELPAPSWLLDAYRESQNLLRTDDTGYRYLISAVMCCSVDLFRELGGFDESFTSYGGEDWELAFRAYNAGAVLAHEPAAVAWHDGPDWAGRGDEDARAQEKAEEREALARRIPEAVRATPAASDTDRTNERDGCHRPVDLVVVWPNTAELPAGRVTATVEALLASELNLALYLDPGQAARCLLAATTDRSRLRTAPVPAEVLARARDLITIDDDAGPGDLDRVRRPLRAGTAGRVVLSRPDGGELTALSLRAVRRAARWQEFAPGVDLIEILFGTEGQWGDGKELRPHRRPTA